MEKLTATDYKKKESRERRKNDKKHFRHLKDLWDKLKDGYFSPAYPCDKDREFNKEDPEYYKREYRGQRSKWLKKNCNKKLRNSNEEELFKNGEYKKNSDFWWNYY